MAGRDQRHRDRSQGDGAALVEGDDLDAMGVLPPRHQVIGAGDRDRQFLRDGQRIARMIAMAMGQQDGRGPGDG